MQGVLAKNNKNGNVHKNEKSGDLVKIIWYPLKMRP